MSIALRNVLCTTALLAACSSPGADRIDRDPSFHQVAGMQVAVLPIFNAFGGFEGEELRTALIARLADLACQGVAINPADQPSGEWTPARSALAAHEAGAQAALLVSLWPSDRPIHPRAPEDAFGRVIGPTPLPGRWFWAKMVWVDARDGRVLLRAESELREPGMKPQSLAWTLLRPVEG